MIICLCLLFAGRASAQWVVSDPGNLAQGIINASKNIIHTSKTATNMVSNFQETVKIYQQGKKYYDALKSVNNLVKDARKVQQTILMVGDITDIYVNSFQRMLRDGNFRPEELSAIAFGYTKLLEESNEVLTELRNVVNITTLSMTDKERMDVVERCHSKMKRYRNLVSYYTNKNISVSYLRAKKKNDLDRIMGILQALHVGDVQIADHIPQLDVVTQALNVGEEHQLLRAQGAGQLTGGGVAVDVEAIALPVGAHRGHHGDVPGVQHGLDGRGVHFHHVAHETQLLAALHALVDVGADAGPFIQCRTRTL